MNQTETPWYLRRKLASMDFRLALLTMERSQTSELLELIETIDPKERPYTFAKKMAEMDIRHQQEAAQLVPPPPPGPPRNISRRPDLVSAVYQIVLDHPGISRQEIVEKLDNPLTNCDPLTNVLTTLRRRGQIANLGTKKRPQWHPVTN